MRPLVSSLALLLCMGAQAADITIDGPHEHRLGSSKPVKLTVQGITAKDLAEDCKFAVYPKGSAEVWDGASLAGDPYFLFFADEPGTYCFVLVTKQDNKLVYLEHEITVTGGVSRTNPYPLPSARWLQFLKGLETFSLTAADAKNLAAVYAKTSQRVQEGQVTTVQGISDSIAELATPLALKGKYAGLASAMEAVYVDMFGKGNVQVNKAEAAEALSAIAWTVYERGAAQ